MLPKVIIAKVLGWGQFGLITLQQASNGHFPQSKGEWFTLIRAFCIALAIHHSSTTDGTK